MGVLSVQRFFSSMSLWALFLLFSPVRAVLSDPLIDIYSNATVTSSSVLEDEGIKFVPQWAVDRVGSRLWSNCFVSKKEINPWWRLDLGQQETIKNVSLDLRDDDSTHQSDVKKEDMANLTVYVDDNRNTAGGSHTLCGTAFTPTSSTGRYNFGCSSLLGQYIHVIVKSSTATYLALCEVFINLAAVAGSTYATYEGEYYIVRPGDDPNKPSSRAIDDNTGTCASTNDTSTRQSLSIRLPWPIFVLETRLYMNVYSGVTYQEYAGSHLSNNGLDNHRVFNYTPTSVTNGFFVTRKPSSFVTDITISISLSNIKLEVCEVQLLNEGSILDIYSSSSAAALSELNTSTLASKAIDNSFQTGGNACYRSAQQPGTWWRLQSVEAKAIGLVVITPLPDSTALSEMNGFSVYVGNKTTNSGKDNVMCGSPWVNPSPAIISITCVSRPIGKYVYIVASSKATSSLSLCEVQIFDCAGSGSDPVLYGASSNVSISASGMAKLTCNATGCPTPSIEWTGPDGQIVSPATHTQTGVTVTSTIDVQGSGGGKYSCIAYNGRTSNATKEITVLVFPMITTSPMDQTVDHGNDTTLTCSGSGYPVPTITWTSPTGSSFTAKATTVVSGIATRIIDVTNQKGADGGGTFKCTASNGIGNDASAQAIISVRPKVTKVVPSTRSVVSGSTVDPVVCEAEGYPKPSVNWKLKGSTVSSSLTTNEYSVGGSSYRSGRNLTLGAVVSSQNGNMYTCEAVNSAGSNTSSFTLTVTVNATFASNPQNVYGKVGDTLSLSCEATGALAGVIEWYKGSAKISTGITMSAENYYCKTGTTAGRQDAVSSSKATVGILGSITSFSSRAFHPGSSSNRPFACTFTANPRPSGELILDGKVKASLIQMTPNSGNSWTVSYPIQSITVEEGGNYACVAKMGSVSIVSYAQLGITCVISVPPQATLLEAGKTKTLTCSGTGYPIPSITWEKTLGSQIKQIAGNESTDYSKREKTSSVTLMGDDIDQASLYECAVTSTAPGSTVQTSLVAVTVKPMIVTKSSAQTGTWGQSEMLTCLATGYPLPTITWTFRGQPVIKGISVSTAGSVNYTSTLTRTAVEPLKDGGVYTCSSTNSAGNGGSINMTLNFDPRVTTDPQSQEVAYGGALSLTCVISSYPAVSSPIQWSKDGIIRLSSSPVGVPNKPTDVASTYKINAVNESDGGNYSCFRSSKPAIITIGNFFNFDPQGGSPIEGNSAQLSCKAVGYPPHNIIWEQSNDDKSYTTVSFGFRSQKTKRSVSSNLTFLAIDRSSSGYYRCRTAGANQVISSAAHIDVYYLPSFSVDLDGLSQSVRSGASFTLTCTAVGNPLPTVDFYKTSLDFSATTTVVSADADHQITVAKGKATLIVPKTKTSDSGNYFCRASNVAGHVDSNYSALAVTGAPSRIDPAQVTVSGKIDSSITFAWTAPYDGNSPILNYTISYKLDGSPDSDYKVYRVVDENITAATLSGLKAFTNYAIRIVASNIEGPAEGTTPAIVRTATGVPTSPRNFVVAVQSSTSVSVQWDSPLEPRGVIEYYRVYYENKGSGISKRSLQQKQFSGTITSGTISGLAKFTRYDLYVLAVNTLNGRELVSPQSIVVSVTTEEDAPSAPLNVRGETVVDLSSMLRVVWDEPAEPNGIIRNYFIFYLKKDAGDMILTKEVDGSKTNEILDNLDSYTLYTIQVQAYTIKNGSRSNPVKARTGEGMPSAPLNLAVASSSPTSVSLRWEQPETPRGLITQYTVFYKETNLCGEENEVNQVVNPPRTEYTVRNLNPNTKWTFTVAASTTAGKGNRSAAVVAKTPPNDIVTATSTTYNSLYADFSTSTTSTRDLSSGCNYVGVAVAVGCTCGGLAGGLIVALIVYIWMKRKLEKSLQSGVDADITMISSPLYGTVVRGTKESDKTQGVYEEMTRFGSVKSVKKDEKESA
ncbi:cell adhesion molecule DSCAML1-like isoform X3 [Oscarella lobularis]|uniref:cell adhesion molecule DSCAML1-like isoform X3 n=1 Tax=Oscarella lobularis TaxID=121494 RepID=UPI003313DECA